MIRYWLSLLFFLKKIKNYIYRDSDMKKTSFALGLKLADFELA